MKKNQFTSNLPLIVFIVLLGAFVFTSSTTEEKSNSEVIANLSTSIEDMKKEIERLKYEEEDAAVAVDPFIGEVALFAGNFPPRGWAFCHGQLLSISSNSALFSLIGTDYGGDGRTTFALPDLRGRTPIGAGFGPGLSKIELGQIGGAESSILGAENLPYYTIDVPGFITDSNDNNTNILKGNRSFLTTGNESNTKITVKDNGAAGKSFNVRDPYVGINYIIAIQGVYPSRS